VISALGWLDGADPPVGAACFGPRRDARDTAVVIVPSLGHEANLMHDGVVELARNAAQRGLPTLVVQLAGTDQSAGSLSAADVVAKWPAAVALAVAQAREAGARRVAVVALRVGALALPDRLDGVDELVLVSPIESGRRLVRELRLLAAAADDHVTAATSLSVAGHRYPSSFLGDLAARRLDVDELPAGTRVLVLDQPTRPSSPALVARAERNGRHRQESSLSAWADVTLEQSVVPGTLLVDVAEWLAAEASPAAHGGPSDLWRLASSAEVADGVVEEIVEFGSPLCRGVAHAAGSHCTGLVLLSSVGPGRLFLDFARAQAAEGRTVLRFDFTATRWSDPHDDGVGGFLYDRRGVADVAAAVSWMRSQGVQRVVAVGFCSGARVLLEAALTVDIDVAVGINVELFEPLRGSQRSANPPSSRLLRVATRVWSQWRGRRMAAHVIHSLAARPGRTVLAFDAGDLGLRFLRSFRLGRAVLAGRFGQIQVSSRPAIGHNLGGAHADQVFADVARLLEEADSAHELEVRNRA
jgi:hypothetical protein